MEQKKIGCHFLVIKNTLFDQVTCLTM
jgi:hypothetical protein